jgi:hypothetical protein
MRVWVPVSVEQFLIFDRTGSLEVSTGFAVTQAFSLDQPDQDEEVLASQILELASAEKSIVLVVEVAGNESPGTSGAVFLTQLITEPVIRAIFASSPQEPDEMLWFGPTERLEVKDFLGLDIGSNEVSN